MHCHHRTYSLTTSLSHTTLTTDRKAPEHIAQVTAMLHGHVIHRWRTRERIPYCLPTLSAATPVARTTRPLHTQILKPSKPPPGLWLQGLEWSILNPGPENQPPPPPPPPPPRACNAQGLKLLQRHCRPCLACSSEQDGLEGFGLMQGLGFLGFRGLGFRGFEFMLFKVSGFRFEN